ncbi:4'-phosphopantetheinyl transferase family protein [Amycolatopsis sp. lyj-23]|uniref:4'-phosphopantetheinyl transferase family protein n=1 Tax=Amycolatopsis sp. lyj-23 TaxID=2789283 RepID=UPI00397D1354
MIVDVWLVPIRPRPSWLGWLSEAERARAARLAAPAGDVFVTSRALQRRWGAVAVGVPPAEVTIDRSCEHCGDPGHGRPRLPGAPAFSVSHTGRWLLLAAASAGRLGADIEDPAAAADPTGLAGVVLSVAEHREFSAAPPDEQAGRLLTAWTRKEAAMKLAGLGLAAAPARVDVRGRLACSDVPGWPREPVHLRPLAAPDGHVAALATTVPVAAVRRRELAELATPDGVTARSGRTGPAVRTRQPAIAATLTRPGVPTQPPEPRNPRSTARATTPPAPSPRPEPPS